MTETKEHKILVNWFRETWPEHRKCIRVSLSGLNFGGGKKAAIMINHIRALGVEDGESDLAFMVPRGKYHALVLEHKATESAHKLSDSQRQYLDYHEQIGNCAVSTRGVEAAQAAIRAYMESE